MICAQIVTIDSRVPRGCIITLVLRGGAIFFGGERQEVSEIREGTFYLQLPNFPDFLANSNLKYSVPLSLSVPCVPIFDLGNMSAVFLG